MALRTEAQWKAFITSAGITDDTVITTYATTFLTNDFNEQSLNLLDKATLTQLGVTSLGHQLAILNASNKRANGDASQSASSTVKVSKASVTAKLSTLSPEMTHPQFRKFIHDWAVYKQLTQLPAGQSTAHLYNACQDEVQSSIINTHPDFLTFDEARALEVIETIVTVSANPAVHRKAFGDLFQGESESVKSFVVRLRSSACDCAFQCPNCEHDLSDVNIKDQFIRGLNNTTLQADILSKTDTLQTLERIIAHAESFETALRDQSTLSNHPNNNKTDNVFKFGGKNRYKNNSPKFTPPQPKGAPSHKPLCSGCGDKDHGHERTTKCPAWGKDCNYCGRPNHFAFVCRVNPQRSVQVPLPKPSGVNHVTLVHDDAEDIEQLMVVKHDPSSDTYATVNTNSDEICCTIQVGHIKSSKRQSIQTKVFPDSGATINLAGLQHLTELGITPQELIPCKKRIAVVGGSTLPCLGWVYANFTVDATTTRQRLYICEKVDRIFLSKEACIATYILPSSFPKPLPALKWR